MIDPDALHCLNEWKGIDSIADGPYPIFEEPPQDANAKDDEMSGINNILSVEELTEEQKFTSMKECFNQSSREINGHN